jgi:hypothetical protein
MFLNGDKKPLPLHNIYEGSSAFVIGGGRSVTPRQLELIKEPGIISASLNEASHYIRPNIFYSSDLHEIPQSVLIDPTIMKFVPTYVFDKPIYEDRDNGKLIGDYPNVTQCIVKTKSFTRDSYFNPDYLYRQKGPDDKLTPFSAIILFNLLYKLGFKTIYLVGYDFSSETNNCTYFYDREYTRGTGRGISKVRNTLEQLKSVEDEFKIYNCSPRSGLKFFEYMDLEEAISKNTIHIEHDIYHRTTKDRFKWYMRNRAPIARGG